MSEPAITEVSRCNAMARTDDFEGAVAQGEGMIQVAQSRAAQEVQAAMIVAQRFPRDEQRAFTKIMTACKRPSLAEKASYMYPKGGQNVTGPSIRLAEVLARSWGNVDCGVIELEQTAGESVVMSYAWDLETNFRSVKVFNVSHLRHTKRGDYKIEDPREIYEMVANQGSRRLRACILAVIPGDVVEAALDACDATLSGAATEPLTDRLRKMVAAFGEMGVTQEMIEVRLGHKLQAVTEQELAGLRKIFTSIRDGFGTREQFFDPNAEVARDDEPAKRMSLRGRNAPQQPSPSPEGGAAAPRNAPPLENTTAGSESVKAPGGRTFPAQPAPTTTPETGPGAGNPSPAAGGAAPTSAPAKGKGRPKAQVVHCPDCGWGMAGGKCPNAANHGQAAADAKAPSDDRTTVYGVGFVSESVIPHQDHPSAPPTVDIAGMRSALKGATVSTIAATKLAAIEAREHAGIELIDDATDEQIQDAYAMFAELKASVKK